MPTITISVTVNERGFASVVHYKTFVVGSGLGLGLACVRASLRTVLPEPRSVFATRDRPKALFPSFQKPAEIANDDDLIHRSVGLRRRSTFFQVFKMAGEIAQQFHLVGVRSVDDAQKGMNGPPLVSFGQPFRSGLCQTSVLFLPVGINRKAIKRGEQDSGEQRPDVIGHLCHGLELFCKRSLGVDLRFQSNESALVDCDFFKRLLKPRGNFSVHRATARDGGVFNSCLQIGLKPESERGDARRLRAANFFFRHSYIMQQKMLAKIATSCSINTATPCSQEQK